MRAPPRVVSAGLALLYKDAALRIFDGLFGGGFGPLLSPFRPPSGGACQQRSAHNAAADRGARAELVGAPRSGLGSIESPRPVAGSAARSPTTPPPATADPARGKTPPPVAAAPLSDEEPERQGCAAHEELFQQIHADLAPWHDLGLRVSEEQAPRVRKVNTKRFGRAIQKRASARKAEATAVAGAGGGAGGRYAPDI